jgi:hypothetical protein
MGFFNGARRAGNYMKYGIGRRNPGNYNNSYSNLNSKINATKNTIQRISREIYTLKNSYRKSVNNLETLRKRKRLQPYITKRYLRQFKPENLARLAYKGSRNAANNRRPMNNVSRVSGLV